jgi:integrase
MFAFGGGTDIVSAAGTLVVSSNDVAQQVGGVAAAAATCHVDVFVLAVLVVSFTGRALIEVGHVGFAATRHRDVQDAKFGALMTFARYANREGPGPRNGAGRLLPAFVECLAATGMRPNEVLAIEWPDVDLLADPPTVTVTGTLIDHGRIAGKPLHRQDKRKHGAPAHTVILPKFGADALTALIADTGGLEGPVFVNRNGGWISLANMRRALRTALPDDLLWVTPHSFRRTVATVVRDTHGPAAAQQQLSHTKLATTEAHYLQRQTSGPDVRETLDRYAAGESGGEKYQESIN